MRFRNLILDIDGTLLVQDEPVPGLPAFFQTLNNRNINYVLATNNSTKTTKRLVEKFADFGVNLESDQILTTFDVTANYLQQRYNAGTSIYLIGEEGFRQTLTEQGFRVLSLAEAKQEKPTAVVVGLDRNCTYEQLATAALHVRQGAAFIATNADSAFPTARGPMASTGAILAFIQTASGKMPEVLGKPHRALFDTALQRLGSQPHQTAIVGDRIETDMMGGKMAGLRTVLMLSGVTDSVDIDPYRIGVDVVYNNLVALTEAIKGGNV
jgi:4-nitrophenyl phosphatase